MSLQGPMIVVAESPATDLVDALVAAGAFPIVEANWADAPTAFISVKPTAVVIAEPGAPPTNLPRASSPCRSPPQAASSFRSSRASSATRKPPSRSRLRPTPRCRSSG